jgi:hypothetical protein
LLRVFTENAQIFNVVCGRVVDSFMLTPAWIRNEIAIEGKKLTECDYTALHPNRAVKLYDDKKVTLRIQK